jgi:hypothetical protein
MIIYRAQDEVYLQSISQVGSPDPYGLLERIDPLTLEPISRSEELPTGGHVWCGATVAHGDGLLYVNSGRWMHALDTNCHVISARELPADRPYNGMIVAPDGRLLTKELRLHGALSTLVALDPVTLRIAATLELPEPSMGRIVGDPSPGGLDVYVPGTTHIWRVRYGPTGLHLDDWRVCYREPLDTRRGLAWDTCLSAGRIWWHDNGDTNAIRRIHSSHPAGNVRFTADSTTDWTDPVGLHSAAANDPTDTTYTPVSSRPGGWVVAPPLATNDIVVAFDTPAGTVVGIDAKRPHEPPRWRTELQTWMQPLLFPRTGELLLNAVSPLGDDLVVLNIDDGAVLHRVPTGSPRPNGMFLTPGSHRDVYYCSDPCIARIAVTPDQSGATSSAQAPV